MELNWDVCVSEVSLGWRCDRVLDILLFCFSFLFKLMVWSPFRFRCRFCFFSFIRRMGPILWLLFFSSALRSMSSESFLDSLNCFFFLKVSTSSYGCFFVFNRLESSLIRSSSVFTSVRMKPKSVFGFIFFFALSDPWRFVFFFWCPFRAAKASQLSRPSRPLKATHTPHTHTHNKKKGSRLRNAIRLFVVCLFVCLFVCFFGGRRPTRRRRGPFDACEIR